MRKNEGEREAGCVCVWGWVGGLNLPNLLRILDGVVGRGRERLLVVATLVRRSKPSAIDTRRTWGGAGSRTGSGAVLSSVSSSDEVYHPQITEETRWTGSGAASSSVFSSDSGYQPQFTGNEGGAGTEE